MIPVLAIVVFLLLEGFFSGSEIAMVSANRLHLKERADAGSRGATIALEMLDRPEFLLGTVISLGSVILLLAIANADAAA